MRNTTISSVRAILHTVAESESTKVQKEQESDATVRDGGLFESNSSIVFTFGSSANCFRSQSKLVLRYF